MNDKLLKLRKLYQTEIDELRESLGMDMPLVESRKLTKIAYFESFVMELNSIIEGED